MTMPSGVLPMFKRASFWAGTACFVLYTISFLLLLRSYTPADTEQTDTTLWALTTVTATIDGVSQEIQLPYTFEGLPSRTTVTLSATFTPPEGNSVYIQSQYTPIRIWIDNTVLYEAGQDGTYPAVMLDPAADGQILLLEHSGSAVTFVAEYASPVTQSSFTIQPFYFGDQDALYLMIFNNAGFPFVFSILLLLFGLFLCCVTLLVVTFEARAFPIFPLGLSIASAGCWLFCDSDIPITFFSSSAQLYLISIFAMAVFPVGFIWFALSMLNLRDKRLLRCVGLIEFIFAWLAVLMLLTGIVRSMIYVEMAFQVLVPLCFFIFSVYILYEYFTYRDETLQRFVLPITVFALFTILEFFNSQYQFAIIPVSFLEMGIILFILSVGIIAGLFMRDALGLQAQAQQAAFDMQLMRYQSELLKKHSNMMMDTADSLKKQRHDLRHQLTVIQRLADEQDLDALNEYLSTVIQQIPSAQMFFCSNPTVNAILSHYTALCQREGIALSVQVNLPAQSDGLPDVDYCVLFGNLLENAVEACRYLPEGERFITLSTHRRYHTLLITMENSFDGKFKRSDGLFRSRKRDAVGIGLTSVQSIAEKHGGDAQFKPNGTVFTSAVYLTPTPASTASPQGTPRT